MSIPVIKTCRQLTEAVSLFKQQNLKLGVVPTMGALHTGHLSLVEHSVAACDRTIVTIFVNPTQFGVGEDLERYPRTLDADLQRLAGVQGADSIVVFAPDDGEIYPPDFSTTVQPPSIAKKLEGEYRPHHFGGVVTVVLKLLNLSQADFAYFGQKDYQQVAVIKQMVRDLNVPVSIQTCPIVREPDGLAMSSRNVYLSESEREVALTLNQTLATMETEIQNGLRDGFEVITEMRQRLIDGGVDSIDYAVIADPVTLEVNDPIRLPAVALIAAHVGKTRLIDNRIIEP